MPVLRLLLALVLFLGIFLLIAPRQSHAQCPGSPQVVPFDEEKLTISATAVGLTAAKYSQPSGVAVLAVVQVQESSIGTRVAGTPAANFATIYSTGSGFAICGLDSIKAFRAIRLTTDATLIVQYYKSKQP